MSWRAAGALLTVLTLAVGTSGVWHWLLRGTETTSTTYQRSPSRLDFDLDGASLVVEPGPPGQVRVERELVWSMNRPEVSETWVGDTLRVAIDCRLDLVGGCRAVYRIQVPAATALHAVAGGGDVLVRDLTGAITVRVDGGDVSLKNTVGDLALEGSSGNVIVTGARSATVRASSEAGDVDLGFAEPPTSVTAGASAGSVRITVPSGFAYAIFKDTQAGVQKIGVPSDPGSPRRLTARTDAGDISIGYGVG